jgi:hypothetical protein
MPADLFHEVPAPFRSYYGAPQTVPRILIECHLYKEYSKLRNIFGGDRCLTFWLS